MCARFTLIASKEEVARLFGLDEPPEIEPRFNIAPTTAVQAAIHDEGDGLVLTRLRWGLVPQWAKDPAIAQKLINARSETAAEKPSFRSAFRKRRCLIPASGFFEWRPEGGNKQPYYVHRPGGQVFAMAGLWEVWSQGDAELRTCTILTTAASEDVARLHDRMPLILEADDFGLWTDPDAPIEAVQTLLAPLPAGSLESHAVTTKVGDPRYQAPDTVEPIAGSSLFD